MAFLELDSTTVYNVRTVLGFKTDWRNDSSIQPVIRNLAAMVSDEAKRRSVTWQDLIEELLDQTTIQIYQEMGGVGNPDNTLHSPPTGPIRG